MSEHVVYILLFIYKLLFPIYVHARVPYTSCTTLKLSNLKLKTRPKQHTHTHSACTQGCSNALPPTVVQSTVMPILSRYSSLLAAFSIRILGITTLCHYAECHCAECRILFIVMLNVDRLSVVMLSVVMLNVIIMLSVVVPI